MSNPECIDESSLMNNKRGKRRTNEETQKDTPRGRRSFSAENNKKRKMSDVGADAAAKVTQNGDAGSKKKRGRPKSLDLSPRMLLKNGDDEGFKSPVPLTPINVAVKRRKGRPKETPPTLVAETPSVPNNIEKAPVVETILVVPETLQSETTPLPPAQKERKKPGRKPKLKPGVLVNKKNVLGSFAAKKGLVLNPMGKKKVQSTGASKAKGVSVNSGTATSDQSTQVIDMVANEAVVENVKSVDVKVVTVEKRKPGRPPGAKNKNKPLATLGGKKKTKAVQNSQILLKKAIMKNNKKKPLKKGDKEKGGKVSGADKVTTKPKEVAETVKPAKPKEVAETVKAAKPKEVAETVKAAKPKEVAETVKAAKPKEVAETVKATMLKEIVETVEAVEKMDTTSDEKKQIKLDKESVQTNTICEVVEKQSLDNTPLPAVEIKTDIVKGENDLKTKDPLRGLNQKQKIGARSMGKIKKEKDLKKVKNKRILTSQAANSDTLRSLAHLATNDLRRKLQSKLIEKLSGKRLTIPNTCSVSDSMLHPVAPPMAEKSTTIIKVKPPSEEPVAYIANLDSDILNLSAQVEQKRVMKAELDENGDSKKKVPVRLRKPSLDQKDMTKFSDTDSVCSEISTVSLSSVKKVPEKQILVLGEDNVDSDTDTVRTRQRFEIIRGKKRKRTLSGEFDLVDERQLKKEMKIATTGEKEDTSSCDDASVEAEQSRPKMRSPVKVSPETIQKLKQSRLAQKALSPYRSAHRAKLLKESPFLTRLKRKRRKLWHKRKELSQNVDETIHCTADQNELNKSDVLEKGEVLLHTEKECLDIVGETADDMVHVEPVMATSIKIEEGDSFSEKVVAEVCVSEVKIYGEDLKEDSESEKKTVVEISDEEYVRLLLQELLDKVAGNLDNNSDDKVNEGRGDSVCRESVGTSSDSVTSHLGGRKRKKKKGWHWKQQNKAAAAAAAAAADKSGEPAPATVKPARVRQNARKSFRQEKESPESTMVRKFELRQKISRSPLDNIALKQSLEENEYYRNEAQKAIRKEAKQLKLRRMFYPQDTEEVAPDESLDGDLSDNDEFAIQPATPVTIEDLMRECRPCSVILTDFIKQLQRAQGSMSTDDQDSDGFISSETETDVFEDGEAVRDESIKHEDNDEETTAAVENDEVSERDMEKKETDPLKVEEEKVDNAGESEVSKPSPMKISPVAEENVKSAKLQPSSEQSPATSSPKTPKIGPGRKRGPKPKGLGNQKVKGLTPSPAMVMPISEQQTARKTVPPLKLKLKVGTSSRRKTYMVEPSSTLGKMQINEKKRIRAKPGPKPGPKLGPKPGLKPGPKPGPKPRLSVLEKNKQPRGRKKSPALTESHDKDNNKKTVKKQQPVATDAYEANFLQFIQQEKSKPITGLLAASKARQNRKLHEKQQYKTSPEGSLTVTAKGSTETTVSSNSAIVTASKENKALNSSPLLNSSVNQTILPEVVDSEAVNYICSQCDKVVCSSEEEIKKHFDAVHPNDKMLYKPLTEISSDDGIHEKDSKLGHTNIFDQMSNMLTEEKQGTDAHSELGKTSAEADSTTDISHEECLGNKDDDGFPENDGNESDSGSLNLKIVEVVSLKDQPMDPELSHDVSEPPQPELSQGPTEPTVHHTFQSSELKVPHYPHASDIPPEQMNVYRQLQAEVSPPPPVIGSGKKKVSKGGIGNTFKCDKCNVHAPLLAAMVAHLRNTHKDIPRLFQCPYCRHMEAETESKIHTHIRQFHPTDNPNPPVALSEPAKRHLKTLSVKLPDIVKPGEVSAVEKDIYMCLKCKVHMSSLEMINEHLEAEHKEVFVFMCPVCKHFKSPAEQQVLKHLQMLHPTVAGNISISLAIDGRQFTRVPCLLKEKGKSSQKQQQPSPGSKPVGPPPNPFSLQSPPPPYVNPTAPQTQTFNSGLINSGLLAISDMYSKSIVSTTSSSTLSNVYAPLSSAPSAPKSTSSTSVASVSRPVSAPKKKKNLLESIELLKTQKQLEQQGLLNSSASKSSSSSSSSSAIAGTDSTVLNQMASAIPPPLMRGPPPLIRYDQLGKVPTSLMNSSVQPDRDILTKNAHSSAQRLNALSTKMTASNPRPIQSSLFDTSDPDAFKPILREKTVLNVPSIPRQPSRYSPKGQTVNSPHTVLNREPTVGAPLDLSKSTPSSSPVPHKQPSPKENTIMPEGLNPDMFKVFNLQPSMAIRAPLTSPPSTMATPIPAQVILPQPVRPNTSNTLAYRPPIPHVASSQMPQIISMPMGAVIGNMLVNLSSLPQPLQAIPAGIQGAPNMQAIQAGIQGAPNMQAIPAGIQGAPNMQAMPQFIRMSSPLPMVSNIVTPTSTPRAIIPVQGNQLMNFNLPMFKCPYCPQVIQLKLAEVQPHIEKLHPGSSIVFMPLDSTK